MMKKVLFVSLNDHVSWGGSEVLWSKTAQRLTTKFKVSALLKKWTDIPIAVQEIEKAGVTIIYKEAPIEVEIGIVARIKRRLLPPINNVLSNDFVNIEDISSFSLVLISTGSNTDPKLVTYTTYLKSKNVKYVIIVQLATDLNYVHDNLLKQLKDSYEGAVSICFLSPDNKSKTEMMLGAELNNITFINNPFNYKQKYSLPTEGSTYNLSCVAAFTSFHKGQDLLLKALSNNKWKERNLIVNLYGLGTNLEQIKRLIEVYKLDDIVKIKGYEANKISIWEENIGCIMPSRMEGQSLAMLEAMSFGRMIISTDVGDAFRLIKHTETGYLIDFPSIKAIDRTLEEAWQNKKNWVSMGEKSYDHLHQVIKTDPVLDFSNKIKNWI
ncbi:glycosyltransferase family 4 protein [Patiriisocius sp. Uisw_047]|jgi:glycosyltransferase involved in cell wall biosynthesis|uniref:glycosyltransferase family 4 protein n=1 Tax=Patiriisocius sp. Uisw_047 TaxID=3230969 RepID=UPI0039EC9770